MSIQYGAVRTVLSSLVTLVSRLSCYSRLSSRLCCVLTSDLPGTYAHTLGLALSTSLIPIPCPAAEYRPRGRRRGRFEITTPDDDEVVDLEEESGLEERRWTELIQPRLVHP